MKRIYAVTLLGALWACQPTQPEAIQQTDDTLALTPARVSFAEITTSTQAWDTLYKQEEVVIVGDTNFRERFFVYRKFTPPVTFSDYKIEQLFKGNAAALDVISNPLAAQFNTVIREAYTSERVNFAGHYIWVSWGCGTACQQNVIIDVRDGKVYTGPESALGAQFRSTSRLAIINPPEATGYYPDRPYCTPQLYEWDEQTHTFQPLGD